MSYLVNVFMAGISTKLLGSFILIPVRNFHLLFVFSQIKLGVCVRMASLLELLKFPVFRLLGKA